MEQTGESEWGADYNLTGIRLVQGTEIVLPQFVGTPAETRIKAHIELNNQLADHARTLGAQVLVSDKPISPSAERPTYRLDSPRWRHPEFSRRLIEQLLRPYNNLIPQIESNRLYSYIGCRRSDKTRQLYEQLEEGNPFVLAFTPFARGHGKYLIERPEQLEKSLTVVEMLERSGHRITNCLEVRPFKRTPSDYYTSRRYLVAAGSGALLAAGLLYSAHTKHEDRVIENDRLYDTWNELTIFKKCLESPESPYFIASRDIRSNTSSGGEIIPLMGSGYTPLSPKEERILKAHKRGWLTRHHEGMPAVASLVGKICGPQLGLCLGVDSVEDELTGEEFMLEVNPGAGPLTYNACWLGGKATHLEAEMAQRREALRDIAHHAHRR